MELLACVTPDQLGELLKSAGHKVLSYDPNTITTLADSVYVFVLHIKSGLWCLVDTSTAT